jgi:hypothetical protein
MKIREALEKDNVCAEEGFVYPLPRIIDRTGRRSVHAQESDSPLCQDLGSLQGQTGKILKKERGPIVFVPPCSYEDPCPPAKPVAVSLQILWRDPILFPLARTIDENGFADQGFERDPVKRPSAFGDMRRNIQMSSQMVAEANRLNRIAIPVQSLNLPQIRP